MSRDQQWKLVNYHHKGICELYNLAQDPWEFQDLSTDPNWQDKKWALTQKSFDSTVSAQSPMTPRIQPYWLRFHFWSTISHKGCRRRYVAISTEIGQGLIMQALLPVKWSWYWKSNLHGITFNLHIRFVNFDCWQYSFYRRIAIVIKFKPMSNPADCANYSKRSHDSWVLD